MAKNVAGRKTSKSAELSVASRVTLYVLGKRGVRREGGEGAREGEGRD